MTSTFAFSLPPFPTPTVPPPKIPQVDTMVYQAILVILSFVMICLANASASRIKRLKEDLDMAVQHQNILKHDNETMAMWMEHVTQDNCEGKEEVNDTKNALDIEILEILRSKGCRMTTREIASALKDNVASNKEVNSRLYTLSNLDMVNRFTYSKKAPVWSFP